jgi:hypothetical protein
LRWLALRGLLGGVEAGGERHWLGTENFILGIRVYGCGETGGITELVFAQSWKSSRVTLGLDLRKVRILFFTRFAFAVNVESLLVVFVFENDVHRIRSVLDFGVHPITRIVKHLVVTELDCDG